MEAFRGPSLDGDLRDDDENARDVKSATLSDAAQTTIHDIFKELDKNHDGKLQIPEIKASSPRTLSTGRSLCVIQRVWSRQGYEGACKGL